MTERNILIGTIVLIGLAFVALIVPVYNDLGELKGRIDSLDQGAIDRATERGLKEIDAKLKELDDRETSLVQRHDQLVNAFAEHRESSKTEIERNSVGVQLGARQHITHAEYHQEPIVENTELFIAEGAKDGRVMMISSEQGFCNLVNAASRNTRINVDRNSKYWYLEGSGAARCFIFRERFMKVMGVKEVGR